MFNYYLYLTKAAAPYAAFQSLDVATHVTQELKAAKFPKAVLEDSDGNVLDI